MAGGMAYGNQLVVHDATLNRRSSHISNSNATFRSGQSPMDDIYMYRTGIRGRKKYTLYLVILILFIIALANILTTFILLGVLHLGYGMQSLEFMPPGWLIRFLQNADIKTVIPINGIVGGFKGEDLHIYGNDQPVFLQSKTNPRSQLEINPHETRISNVTSFKVLNPNTGRNIFSTEFASFGLPKAVRKLNVHQVIVNKISSPVDERLRVKSDIQVIMTGNEGMHMLGREVILAGQDVFLTSRNASIVLDAKNGVVLNNTKFPNFDDVTEDPPGQYKICVCRSSGRLFRIPVLQRSYSCINAVTSGPISPCI